MDHFIAKPDGRFDVHYLIFDSIGEQVAGVKRMVDAREFGARAIFLYQSEKMSMAQWFGRGDIECWPDAIRAAETPWPEGVAAFQAMENDLRSVVLPPPRDLRRRPCWSANSDGDLDLDRYLDGYDAFRSTSRRMVIGQQSVTIVVQIAAPADTFGKEMMWRGVLAAVLCAMFEDRGYSVDVVACDYSRETLKNGDKDLLLGVRIKDAGVPVSTVSLVSVTSAWWCRTFHYAAHYLVPGEEPHAHLGKSFQVGDREIGPMMAGKKCINIRGVWCREEAVEFAGEILKTIGVEEGAATA